MIPLPKMDLELSQSFQLKKMSDELDNLALTSDNFDTIKKMLIETLKQNMIYKANVAQLVKYSTTQELGEE